MTAPAFGRDCEPGATMRRRSLLAAAFAAAACNPGTSTTRAVAAAIGPLQPSADELEAIDHLLFWITTPSGQQFLRLSKARRAPRR